MDHKKTLAIIAAETERAITSKETARETLIAEGIYDVDGNLMPEFGGKPDLNPSP